MKECLICKRVFGDHVDRCDRDRSLLRATLPVTPIIDGYRLDERIGSGNLGLVYRGALMGSDMTLAIKIIHPEIVQNNPQVVNIFLEEAKLLINIAHPYVVRVIDFGTLPQGSPYIVMDYLEGCLLSVLLEQETLELDRAYNLMTQLCEAIAMFHNKQRLHYSLEPHNIYIVYDNEDNEYVKVLDVGLARIKEYISKTVSSDSKKHLLISSPYYLSPEECQRKPIDKRSEVYRLGVIFYQLLTGQLPFQSTSYIEILDRHLSKMPEAPHKLRKEISESLSAVVMKALAKDPKARYDSAASMMEDLKSITPLKPLQVEGGGASLAPLVAAGAQVKDADWQARQRQERLKVIVQALNTAIGFSDNLKPEDINALKLVKQLEQDIENKHIWKDAELYAPNLIKICVPNTTAKKMEDIESIFNSVSFVSNIYKYAKEASYRFFSVIKIDIEIVKPEPKYQGCALTVDWPLSSEISNGLERIIKVEHKQIVKTQMPAIKIPQIALLQPINATGCTNQHVIIQPTTYLGRFRTVLDHNTGQLVRRNDLSFLQPQEEASPNKSISRLHAKIEYVNSGFYLFDTGSTNGTRIVRRDKDQRIHVPLKQLDPQGTLLKNRDIIQLGMALISFEIIPESAIAELADNIVVDPENLMAPGSNAEAFRTEFITTSLTNALAW